MPIELKNVSFAYGDTPVLKDFSLNIANGEAVCLSGESGCGKTTVTRLIMGLEGTTVGSVSAPEKIAAVFQEDRLFPALTVRKNIACVSPDTSRVDALLEKAGLAAVRDKRISALSGGMKRRVAILRAINFAADALILDEAFNGLDPENKQKMAELILEAYKDKPILLISHTPQDAELLGAKTVNMEKL